MSYIPVLSEQNLAEKHLSFSVDQSKTDHKLWSSKTMNQLPAVLQKEIWEYVRGDRAFWKSKFDQVIPKVHDGRRPFVKFSRPVGDATIRMIKDESYKPYPFTVFLFHKDNFVWHCSLNERTYFDKNGAMECFNRNIKKLKNGDFALHGCDKDGGDGQCRLQ